MSAGIKKRLDKLFELYGYSKVEDQESACVYVLEQGMYFGAEIISFKGGRLASEYKKNYSNLGYACKIRDFTSIKDIEHQLFDGFFNISASKERMRKRYYEFASKQIKHLSIDKAYEYIRSPYSVISDTPFDISNNIISDVVKIINSTGPSLIIIEAAAGFGKTCTAYEIALNIIDHCSNKRPLFAELSKDRTARIFKHVLLSEIDEEYRGSVSSDLVRHHINTGNIPFLIDGFDELLSKDISGNKHIEEDFDEIEGMLTTIGDLLTGNASIVLTSRKTAIFSGEKFDKWRDSFQNSFDVYRISIEPPRIKDWLSTEKVKAIKENNIAIRNLSNPILLSILRYSDNESFLAFINEPSTIVDEYFKTLLSREQERQNINLSPVNQIKLFESLAGFFCELNINSEEKSFIQEFFIEFNQNLLEESINRYSSDKPTIEELADTLTNHALLDRIGTKTDRVGFLNDFIFGILIGNITVYGKKETKSLPESKAELAISAWRFYDAQQKNRLWRCLSAAPYSGTFKINADSLLLGEIERKFSNNQFESIEFGNTIFAPAKSIDKCVFVDCTFDSCILDIASFSECSMVNCTFHSCTSEPSIHGNNEIHCSFYACTFVNSPTVQELSASIVEEKLEERNTSFQESIDDQILLQLVKVDGITPRWKSILSIVDALRPTKKKLILKYIQKLIGEGTVGHSGNGLKLNQNGLNRIIELKKEK